MIFVRFSPTGEGIALLKHPQQNFPKVIGGITYGTTTGTGKLLFE
jgi:hypothetical protein